MQLVWQWNGEKKEVFFFLSFFSFLPWSNLECNWHPVTLMLEAGRMRLFSLSSRRFDSRCLLTKSIRFIRSAPCIGLPGHVSHARGGRAQWGDDNLSGLADGGGGSEGGREREREREREDDSRQELSTRGEESDEESEGKGRRWPWPRANGWENTLE